MGAAFYGQTFERAVYTLDLTDIKILIVLSPVCSGLPHEHARTRSSCRINKA